MFNPPTLSLEELLEAQQSIANKIAAMFKAKEDIFKIAAFAHYHFYNDGNGRIARSLMNLILLSKPKQGVLYFPEVIEYEKFSALNIEDQAEYLRELNDRIYHSCYYCGKKII